MAGDGGGEGLDFARRGCDRFRPEANTLSIIPPAASEERSAPVPRNWTHLWGEGQARRSKGEERERLGNRVGSHSEQIPSSSQASEKKHFSKLDFLKKGKEEKQKAIVSY